MDRAGGERIAAGRLSFVFFYPGCNWTRANQRVIQQEWNRGSLTPGPSGRQAARAEEGVVGGGG